MEKRNSYVDLRENYKKLWNMKVTVITIVISELETTPKDW